MNWAARPLLQTCLLTGPEPESVFLVASPRILRGSDGEEAPGVALVRITGTPVLALTLPQASALVEALLGILHPAVVPAAGDA